MKQRLLAAWIVLAPVCVLAAGTSLDERAADSRAAVRAFMGDLKSTLKSALKSGGPLAGIEVCSRSAAAIAAEHSRRTGWRIGRTSLKPRNPANAPDAWERKVLRDFEARRAAGEDPRKMEYFEVVPLKGKRVFRYMKAIPVVAKPCLACHGTAIAPEVARKLDELYPEDRARGYRAGDIRGAFTIVQPM